MGHVRGAGGSFDDWAAAFLRYIGETLNYSPCTVRAYSIDLEQFREYLAESGRLGTVGEVTKADVRGFVARADMRSRWGKRLDVERAASSTVTRRLSALRSFFKFLLVRRAIGYRPTTGIHNPKSPRPMPDFLSEADVVKLLSAPTDSDRNGCRDRAILETLYSTGLRVAELVGLDVSDVDLIGENVKARGKGKKERMVPLGTPAVKAIQDYLELRRARPRPGEELNVLFIERWGRRFTERSIARLVDKYANRVGLPGSTSPHTLRHSFATHLLDRGAGILEIAEMLGHASVTTTVIYTHVTPRTMRAVYDAAFPRA